MVLMVLSRVTKNWRSALVYRASPSLLRNTTQMDGDSQNALLASSHTNFSPTSICTMLIALNTQKSEFISHCPYYYVTG